MIILYTGNGKGKTTAALGQVLRAAGHGLKCCFIQFIKGQWPTGEASAIAAFKGLVEFHATGCGFTWEVKDKDRLAEMARMGWRFAVGKISSGRYDLIVLDEITYLPNYGFVPEAEILEALDCRPQGLHVVMTGREAPEAFIAAADLVTEMIEIKHPFKNGMPAQKGIEY